MKRLAHQHQHSPLMEKRSQYHSYLVQIVPNNTISKAPLNQGPFMEKKHILNGKMQNLFKPVTVNTTLTGSKSPIQMQLAKWHSKKVAFKNQGNCTQAFPTISLPWINIHYPTEFGLKPSTSSSESALVSAAPGKYGYLAWRKWQTWHCIQTKGGNSPSARPEQSQRSANGCIGEELLRSLAVRLDLRQLTEENAKCSRWSKDIDTTSKKDASVLKFSNDSSVSLKRQMFMLESVSFDCGF